MHDDREDFETGQVHRDQEGRSEADLDQEAWALQESEAARHEPLYRGRPGDVEPFPVISAPDEWAVSGGRVPALAKKGDAARPAFFSYDNKSGEFEEHETADAARRAALQALDAAAYDGDGFEEDSVAGVCWGVILASGQIVGKRKPTAEEKEDHPGWTWVGEPRLCPRAEPVAVAPAEPERFGGRLRRVLGSDPGLPLTISSKEGRQIADAIDRDAGVLRRKAFGAEWVREAELIKQAKEQHGQDLRQKVEEAVERLRYAVVYPGNDTPARGISAQDASVDVVNAENLLAELGQIFGERAEPVLSPGYVFFECPECEFSSVQPEAFNGSDACPLCAGDSGQDVRMRRRPCRADDNPEGFDARRVGYGNKPAQAPAPPSAAVLDLMGALKASLKAAGKRKPALGSEP